MDILRKSQITFLTVLRIWQHKTFRLFSENLIVAEIVFRLILDFTLNTYFVDFMLDFVMLPILQI